MKNNSRLIGVLAVAAIAIGGIIGYAKWPADDKSLRAALVGAWRAVDPTNAALHHRKSTVTSEDVVFQADGRLTYKVALASDAGGAKGELWGWEVKKGRLLLRDLGTGSAQEQLPALRFSVSRTKLSVRRKDYPVKVFERVGA